MSTAVIKTRFAPSPTGLMHLGNARTALFNALFAYHHQGVFLLRIEDTDQERSTDAYTQQLMHDLCWLGLVWQEGPEEENAGETYYQSQRSDVYAQYYDQLIEKEQAYPCFCSPEELDLSRKLQRASGQAPRYSGTCAHLSQAEVEAKCAQGLKPTLRFRMPRDRKIEFVDVVKGAQQFLSNDIGDFIIRRADGTPAFFFCNAVDDSLMGVTHAFRGEDHLTNTPRQQLILEALGLPIPQYGHFSIILGGDGSPLSKRNGSQSIHDLREAGWLADAVNNYLARLGHQYTSTDYLEDTQLAHHFDISRISKSASRFDEQQLKHWQQVVVGQTSDEQISDWLHDTVKDIVPTDAYPDFVQAVRANVLFPNDACLWADMLYAPKLAITDSAQAAITEAGAEFFQHACDALAESEGVYKALVSSLKKRSGKKGKGLFMPLRAALTGQTHGPEMNNLLPLMGIEKAQQRLRAAMGA